MFIKFYIDPGTGSLLLQLLVGGVVAFGLFFKNFWYKITTFFKKKDDDKEEL